ncbi:MAG: PPC domain-containing protein, partial [Planctomycetes bacterium]|nr:PPC domain-containing protein [Planctomycetota bacterium]
IDDLPPVAEAGNNKTAAQAQKVDLPCAINGTMEAESWDYYRFSAQANQKVTMEIVARRLGSKLDPHIRLLDATGRMLQQATDTDGLSHDCLLQYTFQAAGDYILEVQDVRFGGGGDSVYRLRLSDSPAAVLPFPLGGKRGSKVQVTAAGPGAEGLPPVEFTVPDNPTATVVPIEFRNPATGKSAPLTFQLSTLDETIEKEPNDEPATATRFTVPQMLNGRIDKPGDIDRFVFTAKKDERIVFETVSRALGSPVDLFMTIQNAAGQEVASNDDNGKDDARIDFKVPADGDYTVSVWELTRRGGSEFVYRIRAVPFQPGFKLLARQLDAQKTSIDKIDVPQAAAGMILVRPVRAEYNGPVMLSAEGLPPGVTASQTVIGPGQADTVITLQAAEGATLAGAQIRIVGTAEINGQKVIEYADASEILVTGLNNLVWPPQNLTKVLGLAVTEKPFFTLEAKLDAAALGRGTALPITVAAKRADDFKEPITLAIQGLPPNIDLGNAPIDKEKNESKLTLTAKNNAPLGIHSIVVTGTGKRGDQQITVVAAAINLDLRMPIELSLDTAGGKIAVNGKLKMKAKVNRLLGFKPPVELELKNLPKGVTAPKVTVPEGAAEAEIELSAAADAAVGVINNLSLVGTTNVAGENQPVTAPNANLEVTAAQ